MNRPQSVKGIPFGLFLTRNVCSSRFFCCIDTSSFTRKCFSYVDDISFSCRAIASYHFLLLSLRHFHKPSERSSDEVKQFHVEKQTRFTIKFESCTRCAFNYFILIRFGSRCVRGAPRLLRPSPGARRNTF